VECLFFRRVENYDYLLAIEESALASFSFRYLTVWSGNTLQALPRCSSLITA
jgi:hypothetical protein